MRAPHLLKTAAAVSVVLLATTVFSASAQANDEFYQVTNVQFNDSLNIRARAGVREPVIATIPANGRTILSTGRRTQIGNSTWVEVVWLGQIGWVNGHFLNSDAPPVVQVQPERKKPAQINYQYQESDQYQQPNNAQAQAPVANGATHLHPANRCTRSVTHTHPGASGHSHNYSCQRGQGQQQVQNQQRPQPQRQQYQGQAHSHPANRCTRSINHTHPGASNHQHRYSCQNNRQAQAQQPRRPAQNVQSHSHPANRCTRSVTHAHGNGANTHQHRYSCQAQQQAQPQMQVQQVQPQPQVQQVLPQQRMRPKYNQQPKYNNYY